MEYAEYYDGYQHDYQEASMDHIDWIYEEEHYMENQGNYQFQPYNNNLSYWNHDVEYPQDQDYTPFQDQQGPGYFQTKPFIQQDQRNYQGNNYGNQRCYEEEMSNRNIGYTNFNNQGQPRQNTYPPVQASEQDDMKSMMKQIMEGQLRVQAEITERIKMFEHKIDSNHREEQAKFEDIYSHLKKLGNQIAQIESEDLVEENISEKMEGKQVEESPKTEEKTEFVESQKPEEEKILVEQKSDSKAFKEEDSLQLALTTEQDAFGFLDTTSVGYEKLLNSHKALRIGIGSGLELKKASNGKTSMENDWCELHVPSLELKPPIPQELRYEFLGSNSIHPIIVNDALSETKTKTLLVELISDSRWVPPVHVEPKKGKVIVVNIDQDELIPTRTTTTHRMCINYRKLDATRKYHFPWPFTDQMLSTFSGFIENVVDVFIDDFSVYGDVFVPCLSILRRVLKRCAETNIVLNWKKCYFMERKGAELGHSILEKYIEVGKAKVFGPPTKLMCEETSFEFNKVCLEVFTKIKRELVNESIVHVPNWSFPFEPGGVPRKLITA